MKKLLIGFAFLVVVGVLVGVNLSRREKAVSVDVARVERRELVERVSGSGRIEARKSVSITSRVVGKVLEVNAEEGDTVEKGALIVRIDPGERTAAMDQARALLAQAKANEELAGVELRKAAFELRRVNGLMSSGLASDQDLEAAQTVHDVSQARVLEARERVRSAQAGVEQARYELEKTVVKAEISGVIVRLSVEEGENVLAGDLYNAGSPMVVIADLSEMEAQILVDETEVVKMTNGQEAEVEVDAFPDRKFAGRVIEVGSSAYNAGVLGSQEAQDFRVRILLEDPPETLRPGLSARAEVVTARRDSALAVPIAALTIRDPEEQKAKLEGGGRRARRARSAAARSGEDVHEVEGVFAVQGEQAVFVSVETGIAGEKDFEVLSGLSEGEEIVVGPFEAIRNLDSGEKVKRSGSKDRKEGSAEAEPQVESSTEAEASTDEAEPAAEPPAEEAPEGA